MQAFYTYAVGVKKKKKTVAVSNLYKCISKKVILFFLNIVNIEKILDIIFA